MRKILAASLVFSLFSIPASLPAQQADFGIVFRPDFIRTTIPQAAPAYFELEFVKRSMVSELTKALRAAEFEITTDEDGTTSAKPYNVQNQTTVNVGQKILNETVLEDPERQIWVTRREHFRNQLERSLRAPQMQLPDQAIRDYLQAFDDFMEDLKNWELIVDYQLEVKPNFEWISIESIIPRDPGSSLESALVMENQIELRLNPVIHVKSITGVLRNPVTSQTVDLDLFPEYNENWEIDGLKVELDAPVTIDIRHPTQKVRIDLAPIPDLSADQMNETNYYRHRPVRTNLVEEKDESGEILHPGVRLRQDDVDVFLNRFFRSDRLDTVLGQIFPRPGEFLGSPSDPSQKALLEDMLAATSELAFQAIKNHKVKILVWLELNNETGELDTHAILAESQSREAERLSQLRGGEIPGFQLVGEFISELSLSPEKVRVGYSLNRVVDPSTGLPLWDFANGEWFYQREAYIKIDLPPEFTSDWKILSAFVPEALVNDDKNNIANNVLDSVNGMNLADGKDSRFSMTVQWPDLGKDVSDLEVRLPFEIERTEQGLDALKPVVDQLYLVTPALSETSFGALEVWLDSTLDPIRIDGRSSLSWVEQFEDQFSLIIEHLYYLTPEVAKEKIQTELSGKIKEGVLGINRRVVTPDSSFDLSIVNFDLDENSLFIDWFASELNGVNIKPVDITQLPAAYAAMLGTDALQEIAIKVRLPSEMRLRITNLISPDADIGGIEFSLRAQGEPELEMYLRVTQDAYGNGQVIPEFHNIDHVISQYSLVKGEKPENGGIAAWGVVVHFAPSSVGDGAYDMAAVVGDRVSSGLGVLGFFGSVFAPNNWFGNRLIRPLSGGASLAAKAWNTGLEVPAIEEKLEEQLFNLRLAMGPILVNAVIAQANGDREFNFEEFLKRIQAGDFRLLRSTEYSVRDFHSDLALELNGPVRIDPGSTVRISDDRAEEILADLSAYEIPVMDDEGKIHIFIQRSDGSFFNERAWKSSPVGQVFSMYRNEIGRVEDEFRLLPKKVEGMEPRIQEAVQNTFTGMKLEEMWAQVWDSLVESIGSSLSKIPSMAADPIEGNPSYSNIRSGITEEEASVDSEQKTIFGNTRKLNPGVTEAVNAPINTALDSPIGASTGTDRFPQRPENEADRERMIRNARANEFPGVRVCIPPDTIQSGIPSDDLLVVLGILDQQSEGSNLESSPDPVVIDGQNISASLAQRIMDELVNSESSNNLNAFESPLRGLARLSTLIRQKMSKNFDEQEPLLKRVQAPRASQSELERLRGLQSEFEDLKRQLGLINLKSNELRGLGAPQRQAPDAEGFVMMNLAQREILRRLPGLEQMINEQARAADFTNNSMKILLEDPDIRVERSVDAMGEPQDQLVAHLRMSVSQDTKLIGGRSLENYLGDLDQASIDKIFERLETRRAQGSLRGQWINDYLDQIVSKVGTPEARSRLSDQELKSYLMYILRRTENSSDLGDIINVPATIITLGLLQVDTKMMDLRVPLQIALINQFDDAASEGEGYRIHLFADIDPDGLKAEQRASGHQNTFIQDRGGRWAGASQLAMKVVQEQIADFEFSFDVPNTFGLPMIEEQMRFALGVAHPVYDGEESRGAIVFDIWEESLPASRYPSMHETNTIPLDSTPIINYVNNFLHAPDRDFGSGLEHLEFMMEWGLERSLPDFGIIDLKLSKENGNAYVRLNENSELVFRANVNLQGQAQSVLIEIPFEFNLQQRTLPTKPDGFYLSWVIPKDIRVLSDVPGDLESRELIQAVSTLKIPVFFLQQTDEIPTTLLTLKPAP